MQGMLQLLALVTEVRDCLHLRGQQSRCEHRCVVLMLRMLLLLSRVLLVGMLPHIRTYLGIPARPRTTASLMRCVMWLPISLVGMIRGGHRITDWHSDSNSLQLWLAATRERQVALVAASLGVLSPAQLSCSTENHPELPHRAREAAASTNSHVPAAVCWGCLITPARAHTRRAVQWLLRYWLVPHTHGSSDTALHVQVQPCTHIEAGNRDTSGADVSANKSAAAVVGPTKHDPIRLCA